MLAELIKFMLPRQELRLERTVVDGEAAGRRVSAVVVAAFTNSSDVLVLKPD